MKEKICKECIECRRYISPLFSCEGNRIKPCKFWESDESLL